MPLYLGAAWYPEHWPESRWSTDLRLMRDADLNVVRVAEFAWSTMEPAEGRFDLDWLERAIALAADHGLSVVLGTPTAAPPAWLTQSYPGDSRRRRGGAWWRSTASAAITTSRSPTYIGLLPAHRRARWRERFGQDDRVIGWQLDNEYNRVSYSAAAERAFQAWLQTQYHVDARRALAGRRLNRGLGNRLLERDVQQLVPGAAAGARATTILASSSSSGSSSPTPIESTSGRRSRRSGREPCRRSGSPATSWASSTSFDHYEICADLDLASWDHYIGTGHADLTRTAAAHDLTRGFKRRNFWVMETQPGNVNWAPVNNVLDRGEARAMAWNAVGHGADAILYWQWRNALNGQEQYHGSLVATTARRGPSTRRWQQLGGGLRRRRVACWMARPSRRRWRCCTHTTIAGASMRSATIATSIPSSYLRAYYSPFARRTVATDIVSSARRGRRGYKLVVAAPVHIVDEAVAAELRRYVEEGGHLVLTVRSGFKDGDNSLHWRAPAGAAARRGGEHVEEYYALLDPVPVTLALDERGSGPGAGCGLSGSCRRRRRDVLGRYRRLQWLARRPGGRHGASTTAAGRVYYVGAWLDDATAGCAGGLAAARRPVSSRCSAACRQRSRPLRRGDAYIIVNGSGEARDVTLPWQALDHLDGTVSRELALPPYGVAVVDRQRRSVRSRRVAPWPRSTPVSGSTSRTTSRPRATMRCDRSAHLRWSAGARGTWKLVGEKFRVLQGSVAGTTSSRRCTARTSATIPTTIASTRPSRSTRPGSGWRAGVSRVRPARSARASTNCAASSGRSRATASRAAPGRRRPSPVLSRWGMPDVPGRGPAHRAGPAAVLVPERAHGVQPAGELRPRRPIGGGQGRRRCSEARRRWTLPRSASSGRAASSASTITPASSPRRASGMA